MAGLDEFLELQHVVKGPRCGYQLLDIKDEERKALDLALGSVQITAKAIQRWCEVRGQTWTYYNIQRHRRGDCLCQRT